MIIILYKYKMHFKDEIRKIRRPLRGGLAETVFMTVKSLYLIDWFAEVYNYLGLKSKSFIEEESVLEVIT